MMLLRSRQLGFFTAVAICCLGVIAALMLLVARSYEQNWWVKHTLEVMKEGQQSLTCLLDCETAARGYMLTGEKEFLEPYELCYRHVTGHLDSLRRLTADNPAQQKVMPRLFELAAEKIKLSQQMIAARSASPLASPQLVQLKPDKRVMDEFRVALSQILDREQALLASRTAESDELRKGVYVLVSIFSASLAAVLTLLFISGERESQARFNLAESISELHRNQSLFDAIVSKVTDYAIFLLDSSGRIMTWNQGAQRIKGYAADEIIGKHFSIFYPEGARLAQHPQDELKQALELGRYEEENWRIRKDGSRFWASVTIAPVRNEAGEPSGFIKVTRDLTSKREDEEKLRRYASELEVARDEAIKANALKSQFVANISHEIRTPLSGVVGLAELLALDPKLDSNAHGSAVTMFESSKRLLTVLNDLLDFSKLEAGRMQVEKIPFSIKAILDETIALSLPSVQKKELVIDMRLDKDIPDEVIGDPGKIRQVLINLVHNAIKFTLQGGIELAAEIQSDKVCFAVTDTGVGVSPEVLPNLFKPFTQADASTTRKFGGTGLGLSISKQLIDLMGGEIGVISEPGRGSTFRFSVPLITASEPTHGQS